MTAHAEQTPKGMTSLPEDFVRTLTSEQIRVLHYPEEARPDERYPSARTRRAIPRRQLHGPR